MARRTKKIVNTEVETPVETPFVEAENDAPIVDAVKYGEEEVSIFIATLVNLMKPKRILEIRKYSEDASQKIQNALNSEMTYESVSDESLEALKDLQGRKFDFILVSGLDDLKYLTAEFKLIERLISRKGLVVYTNALSFKSIPKVIQYALRYGYKTSTLETSGEDAISLIHRNP